MVGRAMTLWSILGYRCTMLKCSTCLCFIDMAAFFDTTPMDMAFAQLFKEGVNAQILRYIKQVFAKVYARIKTGAGVSRDEHMWPGFRQGGRFSTTAGKTIIRMITYKVQETMKGV